MNSNVRTTRHEMPGLMPSAQSPKRIKSEIILGCPSVGCQGVGICRVMLHGEMNVFKCRKTTAWITTTGSGQLRVSFWKSEMDPQFVRRHFDGLNFRVTEPFEMPRRITHALGIKKMLVQPGTYRVSETTGFMTVNFE